MELFVRTLSAPSLIELLNDPNVALDILSILPTVLGHVFYRAHISGERKETQVFDYLTCFKLLRLFRLTRHAKCLQVIIRVLYTNLRDILMLTTLIVFGVFYFGLTQFVLEQMHPNNEMKTISQALWHVCRYRRAVEMDSSCFFFEGFTVIMTVGYSDITEYQFFSYVFAIVGVWYGSISMALVLPSLAQSFNFFHNSNTRWFTIKSKVD